jgi:hypothetical protein
MRSCSLKSIAGWAVGSPFGDCVTRGSVRRYSLGRCEGQGEQNRSPTRHSRERPRQSQRVRGQTPRERGFRPWPLGRSGRRKKRRRRPSQPTLGRPSQRESSGSRRGESGPAERGRAGPPPRDPARVEAGRLGGEVAPQRRKGRGGPERVLGGEAQVAQHAFVGGETQDLCGGCGARERQAGAQGSGGGRVATHMSVEQRKSGAGGKQGIALPRVAARRARAGMGAGGGKTGLSEAFVGVRFARGGWRKGATMFAPRSSVAVASGSSSVRITCAE